MAAPVRSLRTRLPWSAAGAVVGWIYDLDRANAFLYVACWAEEMSVALDVKKVEDLLAGRWNARAGADRIEDLATEGNLVARRAGPCRTAIVNSIVLVGVDNAWVYVGACRAYRAWAVKRFK